MITFGTPSRRVSLRPLALLTVCLSASLATANDILKESFDLKTPNSAIAGQAVEATSLVPNQWLTNGSTNTGWTVSDLKSVSPRNSLKAVAAGSTVATAVPAFAPGAFPANQSFTASVRMFFSSVGNLVPGLGLSSLAGGTIGFLTASSGGKVFVVDGTDGTGNLKRGHTITGDDLKFKADDWNLVSIQVDFTATEQIARYFLNGAAVYDSGVPLTRTFTAGSFEQFQALKLTAQSSNTDLATGTTYFDDVRIFSPVPEPSSLLGMGTGMLLIGAALRRRHRNR